MCPQHLLQPPLLLLLLQVLLLAPAVCALCLQWWLHAQLQSWADQPSAGISSDR
jgi:hypothetical protein